jgi:hypothetical protein
MRREDYAGGIRRQRPKDPAIKAKQTWRAVSQHDFGNGLQDYSIHINFQDPISKLWHCSYILGAQNVTFVVNGVNSSAHTTFMTQEQIEKNFEFQASPPATNINPNTIQPYVNPYPANPNQWAPMQPAVWIAPVNNGIHYDVNTQSGGAGSGGTYGNTAGTYAHAEGYNTNFAMDTVSGVNIPTPKAA